MGAFNDLFLVQRQDNLNAILDEFMPFGLDAGICFITWAHPEERNDEG